MAFARPDTAHDTCLKLMKIITINEIFVKLVKNFHIIYLQILTLVDPFLNDYAIKQIH